MKKVNFEKLFNQFLAGVFGLALLGGVMLNTQEMEAQQVQQTPPIDEGIDDGNGCGKGKRVCAVNTKLKHI